MDATDRIPAGILCGNFIGKPGSTADQENTSTGNAVMARQFRGNDIVHLHLYNHIQYIFILWRKTDVN